MDEFMTKRVLLGFMIAYFSVVFLFIGWIAALVLLIWFGMGVADAVIGSLIFGVIVCLLYLLYDSWLDRKHKQTMTESLLEWCANRRNAL